ncbi:MAG TPA: hypothetical protein VLQ89_04950 [Candidatus Binatia bacterium]|nr:hypothetical protein [Candidatus Binatia bacterium]
MNAKCFLIGWLLIGGLLSAQSPELKLGAIEFPLAFVHAGTEFPQGFYEVVLTARDSVPFFIVYDSKQQLLFEEMAIVQPQPGKRMSSAFRLKKELSSGDEYFRIMVSRPGQRLLGYFLVKKST